MVKLVWLVRYGPYGLLVQSQSQHTLLSLAKWVTPQKIDGKTPSRLKISQDFFIYNKVCFCKPTSTISPTQNPLQNQNSFAIKPQRILQNRNSSKLPEPRIKKKKILLVSPKMETLCLSHSHSHTGSILYTFKPLTTTNQAFPLFFLPCTNHLFSSSLHLHRPSPLRPCHASATPGPPPDSDPPPGLDSLFTFPQGLFVRMCF